MTNLSLYLIWQYIHVDNDDSAPEDTHGILAWTVLFVNINTMYVIEFVVAKFCPITELFNITQSCYSHHNFKSQKTGVCDRANSFGPMDVGWRIGGRIHEWTLCGRY
jgi:hypothetical protein